MTNKRRERKYLLAFLAMLVVMIAFLVYALNNPQGSFSAPLSLVYGVYLLYLIIMFYFLFKFLKK
ncbi:MAG: hypothetical protein Q4E36_05765 [Bacillota bacterium]|nr:hypothetical protein [Bacillota bacterium]